MMPNPAVERDLRKSAQPLIFTLCFLTNREETR